VNSGFSFARYVMNLLYIFIKIFLMIKTNKIKYDYIYEEGDILEWIFRNVF